MTEDTDAAQPHSGRSTDEASVEDASAPFDLPRGAPRIFATTHWSVVMTAVHDQGQEALSALENLCQTYWSPLYAFARRLGYTPEDACDLTQGFFEHLLEGQLVAKADPGRGRFRSFLLGAFKNFISHDRARASAQRRGGGRRILPLDTHEAESALSQELAVPSTPEELFDRNWAIAVLDQAFQLIEAEFTQRGRGALFAKLFPLLQGDKSEQTYAEIARELGTTEGTIKVSVNRLRCRYRELLALVVSQTVSSPMDVQDELEELMAALRK